MVAVVSVFIRVWFWCPNKRAILQFTLPTVWGQQLPRATHTDERLQLPPLLRYCSCFQDMEGHKIIKCKIWLYNKIVFVVFLYTFAVIPVISCAPLNKCLCGHVQYLVLISTRLLSGVCPEGMVYMTAAECEAHGGACPRVCLDMTSTEVQCATACYDGCYCALGFYLLNGSCVPLAQCPCYHQGALHPAGATLPVDACNNWYRWPVTKITFTVKKTKRDRCLLMDDWIWHQILNLVSLVLYCVSQTVPALMEKWNVEQLLVLVSGLFFSLNCSSECTFRACVYFQVSFFFQ